jgi:O-antigen biosynthesis protein WbqP
MAKRLKRIVDFAVSLILLILLGPVMLVIAIGVICDSRGGVFFRQTRVELKGREFEVIKFRSMKPWRPNDSHVTSSRDLRITKVGKFPRQTSLGELPQLINVLRGEMSLVGPRPLLPGIPDRTRWSDWS